MKSTQQIARHYRDLHFGGNWTDVNLKEHLEHVTWQQATTSVQGLNSIATLVFHMNYYANGVLNVLRGGALVIKHKYSFDHPPIQSEKDWVRMLQKTWDDAESFAAAVEQLPEDRLWATFTNEKYGNFYRNIQGLVEHGHYHLGQIVLIRKILDSQTP